MYRIEVERECGCFKKSGLKNNVEFEDKEDALARARVMECRMNQEFCFKHYFEAVDYGDRVVIKSEIREDDDDCSHIDIKGLLNKSPLVVQFDENERPRD